MSDLPFSLETREKDITNFDDFSRLASYLAKQPNPEVIALKVSAKQLSTRRYPILSRQTVAERKSA